MDNVVESVPSARGFDAVEIHQVLVLSQNEARVLRRDDAPELKGVRGVPFGIIRRLRQKRAEMRQ